MKKKIAFFTILLRAISAILTGCVSPFNVNHPFAQPGTRWRSSDGAIEFYVPDQGEENAKGNPFGTMSTTDGEVEFVLRGSQGSSFIGVCPKDESGEYQEEIELWSANFWRKNTFTATIVYSTYYEQGQKITFHRVDT